MEALYDYRAQQPDELTFVKHAIIRNVVKDHEDWWRGDYGFQMQKWFPANHVREIQVSDQSESSAHQANFKQDFKEILGFRTVCCL